MKKLAFTALLMIFAISLGLAQQVNSNEQAIANATQEIAQRYNLDASQMAEVRRLQVYKFDNLQEIEAIKTTQPQLYLKKRQGVLQQTRLATRAILREDQQALFDRQLADEKSEKEALLAEKRAAGASKVEIQSLLLELAAY